MNISNKKNTFKRNIIIKQNNMISQLGKKVLIVNSICIGFSVLQHYCYYDILASAAYKNFTSTKLPESPNLSEPVLIIQEESKFVFAHRGGQTAVESVIKDTFTNNKGLRRAIALQLLSTVSVCAGVAKNRRFLIPTSILLIVGNLCYTLPIAASGLRLYNLSCLVQDGDREI